jgi:propionate CoA-transferase
MNAAAAKPVVKKIGVRGRGLAVFPQGIVPQVAIIRATTADERGNLL